MTIDYQQLAARVEHGEFKALSIKQPYPHHIFHDGKDVENRDWATRGRGWIMIHAGKQFYDNPPAAAHADLPRGGVVGMARIVDCVQAMASDWFFGPYGFVLRDAFPLPLVPCRGQLAFFNLPADVLHQVAQHIRERIA
ncbi:hypothetical protein [Sphingobium cupriresistens]|uniref:hypothetical protein n=1 Tax=Sphingobium cupriresistens TaxID=1132417 RepID=UPI003BADC631